MSENRRGWRAPVAPGGRRTAVVAGLLGAAIAVALAIAGPAAADGPPVPPRTEYYTAPDTFPLWGSGDIKVGCTFLSTGPVCADDQVPYHGYWALDLMAPRGTPVHAAGAGVIEDLYSLNAPCLGAKVRGQARFVLIRHAGDMRSYYTHLDSVSPGLGKGSWVTSSTQLGTVGDSGQSTCGAGGTHLHFEVRNAAGNRIHPGNLKACDGDRQFTLPNGLRLQDGTPSPVGNWQALPWGKYFARSTGTDCYPEGRIVRRSDGISWVVQNGVRLHLPDRPTDLCAQYRQGVPAKGGLTNAQIEAIPENTAQKYGCDLSNTILRALDKPDPKPSYTFYGGVRRWIPDGDTFRYFDIQRAFDVVDVATEAEILKLTNGGNEAAKLNPGDFEGQIIRRSDGISWVIVGGKRRHIPDYATALCAQYFERRPLRDGLTASQAGAFLDDGRHACSLDNKILRAMDKPDPKPSYTYYGGARRWIPDGDTFRYFDIHRSFDVADVATEAQIQKLPNGGNEAAKLNPGDFEGQIIRRSDGISWVIVGGKRRHIPDYPTAVCAQFGQNRMLRDNLSTTQAGSFADDGRHACDLNGTILQASDKPDPKPSYAFHDGRRYWIPDGWTYDWFVRRGFRIVGAPEWAINDGRMPDGGIESPKLDPASVPPNSVLRHADGVSWVVDGNRNRHHIPYVQDDVCWRNLRGLPVNSLRVTSAQAAALPEHDPWPCIIGNRVVRSSDGSAHFVDTTNTRQWIPDSDTYWVYARAYEVVGPWPAGDVNAIPQGPQIRPRIDPEAVKNSIVCRSDGVCWAVDGGAVRHHIPSHADNVCWRWVNGWGVTRSGLSDEQARSLPEAEAWGCNLNGRIIATNEGAAYYMEGNTRRWIQDPESFYCYSEGRHVIRGMGMGEAGGIPEGGAMPVCLGPNRVLNKVVREQGGTAYFVDGAGWWHWIPSGAVYNCLVSRYPLINNVTWAHINNYGLRREGGWATC